MYRLCMATLLLAQGRAGVLLAAERDRPHACSVITHR